MIFFSVLIFFYWFLTRNTNTHLVSVNFCSCPEIFFSCFMSQLISFSLGFFFFFFLLIWFQRFVSLCFTIFFCFPFSFTNHFFSVLEFTNEITFLSWKSLSIFFIWFHKLLIFSQSFFFFFLQKKINKKSPFLLKFIFSQFLK